MKTPKILTALTLAFFFLHQTGILFSAPAVPLVPGPNAQIGIVAAVRGTVNIGRGAVGKVAESGMPVYLGDEVRTDDKGSLQVLLLDETVFKIGPNSAIVIDKFVYDPATDTGEVKARVVKGVFRFVTGKIARKDPSKMKVDLPAGTIGIRGTIVAGQASEDHSLVVLLGPGEKNNTGNRNGRITVGNETSEGNKEVMINKTGFGTEIEGQGGAPKAPFEVPKEKLDAITGALGAEPGGGAGEEGSGESASEQSGEDSAAAGDSADETGSVDGLIASLGEESQNAAQRNSNDAVKISDGPTSREQLQSLADQLGGGVQHFEKLAVTTTGIATGSANFYIDIDFGARKVGGGNSRVQGTVGGGSFQYSFNDAYPGGVSFGTGTGNASFNFTDIPLETVPSQTCANCTFADVDLGVDNQGGAIGSEAHVSIKIKQGVGPAAIQSQGSDIAQRLSGAS